MPWRRRSAGNRNARVFLFSLVLMAVIAWYIFLFDLAEKQDQQKSVAGAKNQNSNRNPAVISEAESDTNLYSYLDRMSLAVKDSVKEIRINDDPDHYGNPKVLGHYCPFASEGIICIKSDAIQKLPGTVYHEATHAYWFKLLRDRNIFTHKWAEVGFVPITDYGATSPEENLAELVANFHLELDGKQSAFSDMDRYIFGVCHRQQLEYARDYGFIASYDYQRFLLQRGY